MIMYLLLLVAHMVKNWCQLPFLALCFLLYQIRQWCLNVTPLLWLSSGNQSSNILEILTAEKICCVPVSPDSIYCPVSVKFLMFISFTINCLFSRHSPNQMCFFFFKVNWKSFICSRAWQKGLPKGLVSVWKILRTVDRIVTCPIGPVMCHHES